MTVTPTVPTLPGMPEQIARYQLLSELGRGSMGQVYLALDPNIERKVALKLFLPLLKVGPAEQWELRQRFILEARAAGKLNHPGIVTIFDADTDPDTGLSYLAMEWVNGPSLDALIRESGPLAIDRTVAIVEQVATALDAAHRQGLVHRDIKPANILLEGNGRAKVTDFGIAKLASMSITATGWIPGSPFYMSPEQVRNQDIDRRSDLYSLGAVLYQCLTGVLPFEAESLAALTHMILEIDPRPPQSINPAVTADFAAVVERALAKSPGDRFENGVEFGRALRLAAAGRFRRTMGSGPAAAGRAATRAAVPGSDPTTATIGLVSGPAGDRDPAPAGPEVAAPPAAAREVEEVRLEPDTGSPPSLVTRLSVALAVVLGLLALWSLRPVESGPTGDPPRTTRVTFSGERFDNDFSFIGDLLELPAALRPPADEVEPQQAAAASVIARAPAAVASAPAPAPVAAPETGPGVEPAPGASLPEVAPAPVREPPIRATSRLELVYRNRLKNAALSVSIDGERVWSDNVASSSSLFKRAVGKNVWTSLPLTPGEHLVDVRITGTEGKLDLVRQTAATFEAGRTHRLRVTLTPLKKLKLSWKETPSG